MRNETCGHELSRGLITRMVTDAREGGDPFATLPTRWAMFLCSRSDEDGRELTEERLLCPRFATERLKLHPELGLTGYKPREAIQN